MKKIEFIWRHILYQSIEKRQISFQQQELAKIFNISSSTVNLALAPLRRMGAVTVGGRGFTVSDWEKILYHWANHRLLEDDISLRLSIKLPILEIEGRLPDRSIPTAYTAIRERYGEPPADYDTVYCYHPDPSSVYDRFVNEMGKSKPNCIVFKADPYLPSYGASCPLGQVFVDLWNLTDWFAKDFTSFLKDKINELLS